jgi:predicted nucleotidyltransferase
VLRVLGYGAVQLHEFARKWAKLLPGSKRRTEAEAVSALESVIFSNPRVRALASNPLVLTILVLLNDARGGTLPRRRADLYAKVVDVFLDTWESSKRSTDKFDETFDIDLDAREFRWLLSDLALAMQKADRTLAARWWMVERMREYLQQKLGFDSDDAKDASDRIISYLAERTGLLEERGLDLFGFSHRTLLEYFASLGVINDADSSTSRTVTDILSGYLYNPRWCEVVRLVAAQLTPPVAESLISTVLDDPDPVGRFLRRGALLALRCLSDGTSVPNRRLVSSVFDSLADLGTSKWLGITLATIDALEGFGGTRLDELAQKTILSILDKAKSKLEPEEYTCLFERVHFATVFDQARNKLGPDFDKQAAREVTIEQNGTSIHIMYVNARLRAEHPLAWYKSICSLLRDERNSENFKVLLVHELGRQIATDAHSRRALRKILDSDASAALRAACATALGTVNFGRHDAKLLLRRLSDDQSDRVRAACAAALTHAAVAYPSVRERLVVVLQSSEPAIVRAGAARGLGKVAPTDLAITSALLKLASKRDAEDKLRMASVWSLEEQIGRSSEVTEAFKSWLGAVGSPLVQRGAAQALAMTMAEEAIPWDRQLVERVEHILMNLDEPCPHALESLQALATAREVRRGLRLETVLREAFKSVSDQIELAFVFGSTARSRQSEQSDIDLMVIGKTSLKDLSTPLRNAEKTLGRRITPVIYSRESFQQKYHAGDPFLIDVYRREKIPVIQSANVSSRKELDDELGAMVAERMAATG